MKLPVVAIVGRPNVGKSTLFNRIIHRQVAIVDDRPGVTRDRNAWRYEWNGYPFLLLDTGGYVLGGEDVMERAVSEQTAMAVEEATVILFLADVRTGITEYDGEVADLLRKADKPVVLAVNKVDNERFESDMYEFYNLGLGDPYPVSGLTGRGTGDLLDAVTENLPEPVSDEEDEDTLKLALIGRPNVGKSSIVNCLTGKQSVLVTEIPGTTRDSTDTHIRYRNREIILVDTAGLRRTGKRKESIEYFSSLRTVRSLDRCDVAIAVIDASEGLTAYDKNLIDDVEKAHKGLLIVANKWDLVPKDSKTMKHFEDELLYQLPDKKYYPIVFTSALTSKRVRKILDMALEIEAERKRRIPTAEFNKFLESLVLPPGAGNVRIYYGTQYATEPPSFSIMVNDRRQIKENAKRFIERRLREQYGFTGTTIILSFKTSSGKKR